MFSLGFSEIAIITIIALLIFGPNKLPEFAKTVGSAINEFKKGAENVQKEVEESIGLDETSRKELKDAFNIGLEGDEKKPEKP